MNGHNQSCDSGSGFTFRTPRANDGVEVHRLIAACPPLDTNSAYCNLLQCTHFSDTCLMAHHHGILVGFVSAYLLPRRPNTLFIWQIAVGESARGQGLAKRMVLRLLRQPVCGDASSIETTITQNNTASWALFTRLSQELKAELSSTVFFDRQQHFDGQHDTELLVSIGPISINASKEG